MKTIGGNGMPKWIGRSLRWGALCLLALVFAFPFYWMFTTSIKQASDIFVFPPKLLPYPFSFKAYPEAWAMQNFGLYMFNSFKIVLLNVVFAVLSSALAAYGFARIRFKGREVWFLVVLATMIIPTEVLIIPQYLEFKAFGWLNTHLPLIIPALAGNPFYIFLIRQYMKSIPYELDEAAIIDGCGRLAVFWRILLPIITPALATCAVFQFMGSWNDYMGPLIYLQTRDKWTLALGIVSLNSERLYSAVNWNHRMAMATIYSLFPLIMFFLAQKKLIGGIATTGIKG